MSKFNEVVAKVEDEGARKRIKERFLAAHAARATIKALALEAQRETESAWLLIEEVTSKRPRDRIYTYDFNTGEVLDTGQSSFGDVLAVDELNPDPGPTGD